MREGELVAEVEQSELSEARLVRAALSGNATNGSRAQANERSG
jgi:hypothetical protein